MNKRLLFLHAVEQPLGEMKRVGAGRATSSAEWTRGGTDALPNANSDTAGYCLLGKTGNAKMGILSRPV